MEPNEVDPEQVEQVLEAGGISRMRVLVVSHKALHSHRGVYYTTGGIPLEYRALADLFAELHVLNNVARSSRKPQGLEALDERLYVHRILKRSYGRLPLAVAGLVKASVFTLILLRRHDIGLVWAKGVSMETSGALWAASVAGVPSILRLQGYEFSRYCDGEARTGGASGTGRPRYTRKRRLLKLAVRYCSGISFVSEPAVDSADASVMKSVKGHRPSFPNPAVTEEHLAVPPLDLRSCKREVLFVGRLVSAKNVDVLLDAFARVLDRLNSPPGLMLKLVGGGYLRSELERLSRELNMADRVQFLGQIPRTEVWRQLSGCWVLVMPSAREGSPKAVIEAMAAARPVVASRVGALPELIVDGSTGYLVEPGDAEDLAEKLERILADNQLAIEMGIRGRERVKSSNGLSFQGNVVRLVKEVLGCDVRT